MPISTALRDRVFAWVADDPDRETSAEALALVAREDEVELEERFGRSLEFGTAGLRGLLGAGPNRMNRRVVRRAAAGLCSYLLRTVPHAHARGIVLVRDGREGSDIFTRDVARVAMGMGFVVHYFVDRVPTPLCAFAVTETGAAAGVMITASHNPPEYNGLKVYWGNGAQIVPPHDVGIAAAIEAIENVKALPSLDSEAGRTLGLFRTVAPSVERHYLDALAALDFGLPQDKGLSIAYTPLHGVGGRLLRRAFDEDGFTELRVVSEQFEPDAKFPTVRFPNPEEPGAMDLVLKLARERGADLVLANDPDADRLAVAYRSRDGEYVSLSGNEIGLLLGHHRLADDPKPAADRLVISTLVSSPQLGLVARDLGARYAETLTGFKWIANVAMSLEESTGTRFIFGFEEALGSSVGTVVRDKDGVGSALVVARLAAHLKTKGQTLGDRLDEIARKYGVFVSLQHSVTRPGSTGASQIEASMARLRATPPSNIGGAKVQAVRDLLSDSAMDASLGMPPSNVLIFDLEGGGRVVARPSGTEPKIKYYFDLPEQVRADETLEAARRRGHERLEALKAAFIAMAER